jgi:uncharacterized membrane protein YkvA (DUF1232 family)
MRLSLPELFRTFSLMAELADFVKRGAAKVSPQTLRGVYKKLPRLKLAFAQIDAPQFPHLNEQLQFLANLIEDFADGKADEIPYCTIASACYALIYAQREWDLIPDSVPDIGMADDSGVVRVTLIENERILAKYAEKVGVNWRTISVDP